MHICGHKCIFNSFILFGFAHVCIADLRTTWDWMTYAVQELIPERNRFSLSSQPWQPVDLHPSVGPWEIFFYPHWHANWFCNYFVKYVQGTILLRFLHEFSREHCCDTSFQRSVADFGYLGFSIRNVYF